MEFITTVEGIMSTNLLLWDGTRRTKNEVVTEAAKKAYDTVPVCRTGRIDGLLYVATGRTRKITHDLLLSRDTPIRDALEILSASPHLSLLVLYRQKIEGIVTPSDFNKVLARSYFYNLLAQYEMLLAEHARRHYIDLNVMVVLLKPEDKTVPQYRKKIRERSSSAESANYAIDLIHNLYLEELESLILKDESFRSRLGFTDLGHAERLLNGINNGFRRKVMHPTRPLLSDTLGIEQLNIYVNQVAELVRLLSK